MSEKRSLKSVASRFYNGAGKSILSSVLMVLAGILLGFILMLISAGSVRGANPAKGLGLLFAGPFSALNPGRAFGNMLFYTVPLIFTGLSVAIAYKTGLFNIGAPGQFLMGTMLSLEIALNIDSTGNPVQGFFVWLLALVVGMIGGILWGLIPGALKAYFGINEVIICIMTNWIAANMVSWVFKDQTNIINTASGKSGYLITTGVTGNGTPTIGLDKISNGSYLDFGIVVAILFAVLIWFLLNKTTLGYSMKACGLNKDAAKYAGINDKFNIMMSMGIAGGLAAIGGVLYYLNPRIELQFQASYSALPSYGFDGISAAFLANCNPVGVIFAALLIRYLSAAGANLSTAGYNKYFADIIIAVIIYFAGFTKLIQMQFPKIAAFFKNLPGKFQKKEMVREGAAEGASAQALPEVSEKPAEEVKAEPVKEGKKEEPAGERKKEEALPAKKEEAPVAPEVPHEKKEEPAASVQKKPIKKAASATKKTASKKTPSKAKKASSDKTKADKKGGKE